LDGYPSMVWFGRRDRMGMQRVGKWYAPSCAWKKLRARPLVAGETTPIRTGCIDALLSRARMRSQE